jgi:hypothetical protein
MAITPRDREPSDDGTAIRELAAELQLAEVSFDPDTDTGLVRAGYAALTTLVAVVEAWPGDALPAEAAGEIEGHLAPGAPLHHLHRIPDPDTTATLRRPSIGT